MLGQIKIVLNIYCLGGLLLLLNLQVKLMAHFVLLNTPGDLTAMNCDVGFILLIFQEA